MSASVHTLWGRQFVEHVDFLKDFARHYGLRFPSELNRLLDLLRLRWEAVKLTGKPPPPVVCKLTVIVERRVGRLFAARPAHLGGACVPDLAKHMVGETLYYAKRWLLFADTRSKSSSSKRGQETARRAAVHFWSKEHAENLEFIKCQIQRFVQEHVDTTGEAAPSIPTSLPALYRAGADLLQDFEQLSNETAGSQHRQEKSSSRTATKHNASQNLFARFQLHSARHDRLTRQVLQLVPVLPVSEKAKEMLTAGIEHERREAAFALQDVKYLGTGP